jgi:hypothetical protein
VIDDYGRAATADRLQKFYRFGPFPGAHAGQGLIEQKQAGGSRQREANLEAPLFPIGEIRNRDVGASRQFD